MIAQVNKHIAAGTSFFGRMILNHDKRKIWIPEAGLIIMSVSLEKTQNCTEKSTVQTVS